MSGRTRVVWGLVFAAATLAQEREDPRAASAAATARAEQAWERKRWDEAEREFRAAIAADRGNHRALNGLAWMLVTCEDVARRRPAEALELARRACEARGQDWAYRDTLATALDALGQHEEAARIESDELVRSRHDPHVGKQLREFAGRALEALRRTSPEPDPFRMAQLYQWAARGGWIAAGSLPPAESRAALEAALAEYDRMLATGKAAPPWKRERVELQLQLERWREAETAVRALLAATDGQQGLRGLERHDRARELRLLARALDGLGLAREGLWARDEAFRLVPDVDLSLELARGWVGAGDFARARETAQAGLFALAGRRYQLAHPREVRELELSLAVALEHELARAPDAPAAVSTRTAAIAARVRAEAAWAVDTSGVAPLASLLAPLPPTARTREALARAHLARTHGPRFSDATAAALPPGTQGWRMALGDLDQDGDPDLVIDGQRLLRNDGRGRFEQVDLAVVSSASRGAVLGDHDCDGDLDLLCFGAPGGERLLRNEGELRFVDVTAQSGLGGEAELVSEAAAWGDWNGDGRLDLFVAGTKNVAGGPLRDRLLLSGDDGRFAPHPSFAPDLRGGSRGLAPADQDQDGDLDLFVARDQSDDQAWFQEQGELRARRGQEFRGPHARGEPASAIGPTWGDLDCDGALDLVVAVPSALLTSTRIHLGSASRDSIGLGGAWFMGLSPDPGHVHALLFDPDDDADLDLFLTGYGPGQPSRLYENRRGLPAATPRAMGQVADALRRAFLPLGGAPAAVSHGGIDSPLWFDDSTWLADARVWNAWGAVAGDLDLDGDQDLVIGTGEGVRVLLAQVPEARRGKSVRVRLVGRTGDTWGAGATAVLTVGKERVVRQLALGEGAGCQSEPVLHFGVGQAAGPFALEVRWPGGAITKREVGPGRHRIDE